jgi:hypothetical protein
MPLTVSEITERLKPGASKTERHALSERIAHWTRERLLVPVGRQNPGTGRARRYNDAAFVDVMALGAMADADVPIETMRLVIFMVREQLRTGEWRQEIEQGNSVYLEIDQFPGGQTATYLHNGRETLGIKQAYILPSGIEHAHIINLTRLFRSVIPPQSETEDDHL